MIFVAIFLHKIPEGFTVASLMLASGQSRGAALASSAILGAATLAGMALMFVGAVLAGFGYLVPLLLGSLRSAPSPPVGDLSSSVPVSGTG